ncbi:MAG TPA: hypothetical protein VD926_16025 [Acidimicrobiales bacterium]|nr:hypothetical protein [Acidimicrobiales bacterium]
MSTATATVVDPLVHPTGIRLTPPACNTSPIREALADYLDRAAWARGNTVSVFDRDHRVAAGADILAGLAAYVRGLPTDDEHLRALATVHPYLAQPSNNPRSFFPTSREAAALVESVGTERIGTRTEFFLRFVALELSGRPAA